MAVRLTLDNQTLDIYNIYRNIQHGELDLSQLFAHTENTNTMIMGDFNAHHEILSSTRPSNTTGDHIYQSLNDFNRVSLLNNGQSTPIRGGRLDLSFISTVLRPFSTWQLHSDLTSDHFATRTKIYRRYLQYHHLHPDGIKTKQTGTYFSLNWKNGQMNMIHHKIWTN